jgi:hypothetical protein
MHERRLSQLKRDIGNDFHREKDGGIMELYSLHCSNCDYSNIHDIRMFTCCCGKELQGILVYRKIGDTVILIQDKREREVDSRERAADEGR